MHQLYTYKLGVLEADLGRQYIKFYLHVAFLLGILLDLCVIGIGRSYVSFVNKYHFE